MTDIASQIGSWAFAQTGWTTLLLALAVAADIVLCRRVAAAWRIWLYVAVLVRLVLPVQWASPIGIGDALGTAVPAQIVTFIQKADTATPATTSGTATTAATPAPASMARGLADDAVILLMAAYLVGLSIAIARLSMGVRTARRLASESKPSARGDANSRYLVHESFGPAVVGVLRPQIIVPRELEDRAAAMRAVLAHERAHIDRRDPLLACALRATCAIFWPIAPVWVAAARIRTLMEQACDDRVLARGIDRLEYGRVLLDAAGLWKGPAMATVLPFGAGVKGRIVAMCQTRRWKTHVQGAVVLGFAVLAIACSGERPASNRTDGNVQGTIAPAADPASEGRKTTIELEIRVLDGVPEHPKLKWNVTPASSARAADSNTSNRVPILADIPIVGTLFVTDAVNDPGHALTADELTRLLAEASVKVLAAPRLLLRPDALGKIEVGESRDGTLVKGFTLEMKAAPHLGGTAITMQYQEADAAGLVLTSPFKTTVVPTGGTQAFLASGAAGRSQRVILVTPAIRNPVPPAAPTMANDSGAYIKSMEYPQVFAMMNIAEVREFVPFGSIILPAGPIDSRAEMVILADLGKQGTVIMNAKTSPANAQVTTGWARLLSPAGLNAAEEQLARRAGYAHVASPAIIAKPGEWASIETNWKDKAGAAVGLRIQAKVTPDDGNGDLRLSLRLSKPGGEAITSADNLPIEAGRVLMALIPPEAAGGVYRVISVNAKMLNSPADYPAQTLSIPEGQR